MLALRFQDASRAGLRRRAVVVAAALSGLLLGCGGGAGAGDTTDSGPTPDATAADAAPHADAGPPPDAGPRGDALPAPGVLAVRVSGPDGTRPADLRVWLAADDGEVIFLDCGAEAPADPEQTGARCTSEGVALEARPAALALTLKAPGLATRRARLAPAAGETPSLTLAALPAPERTEDFATGFAPGALLDELASLAFRSAGELGPTQVVKWYLEGLGTEAPQLWFQNTARNPIHYAFVHDVLGRALSNADFEQQTYRDADRRAMAGSLILYPEVAAETPGGAATSPLTIEFFPTDTLTPEMALQAYLLLEERLPFVSRGPGPAALWYVPAGSVQEAAVQAAARDYALAGARWLSQRDLYAGIDVQYLNPGVAYGTLRLLTPEQLETEVVSFEDVVVLPRLPNEMPLVGGTITAELQTPLAHVNVAARARNTPNLALLGAPEDPRIAPLLGKLVRFEVAPGGFTLEETTLEEARAYWRDRRDRPPFAPDADLSRLGLIELEDLYFADANVVGVKAANVAELHHLLGDAAPKGFAVPFGEYRRYLTETVVPAGFCARAEADCLEEGRDAPVCAGARGLCEPAEATPETFETWLRRVEADDGFLADSALRESTLDSIRWVMRHADIDPDLATALDAHVVATFAEAPVRLRSSTNAEDLDRFTGAGLYDSTTAYGRGSERASKEIRKVWASAWNWRAFEERSFWNVVHDAVQVGVLVQDAFPDEQVNGVLITQNIAGVASGARGFYVNAQKGEVAVTNPEDGALPEIFSIVAGPAGTAQVVRERYSSLNPDASLLSDAEIDALYRAAARVQHHFAPLYDESPETMALDLEWKFVGRDRRLVFKQVRPYAVPAP